MVQVPALPALICTEESQWVGFCLPTHFPKADFLHPEAKLFGKQSEPQVWMTTQVTAHSLGLELGVFVFGAILAGTQSLCLALDSRISPG